MIFFRCNCLKCWYGDILSDDGQNVEVTSLEWDADYQTGDTFEVEYQIQYDEGEQRY